MIVQVTYFKDPLTLKRELDKLVIPLNAPIILFNVVSMYTRILSKDNIEHHLEYLLNPATLQRFKHYPVEALFKAIKIVMRNNPMQFVDIIIHQLVGITMGISSTPTLINLYKALHKGKAILLSLQTNILYLCYFINNGLAIWMHKLDPLVDQQN